MSDKFVQALKNRRSVYALGNKLPVSQEEVTELVKTVVKESPSSFNSQSSRVIVLYGEHHKKLWEIVKKALKPVLAAEAFAATEEKVNKSFASGAGTVLFYEDQQVVKRLQEKFPLYADNFPVWSEHSSAMAQLAVWTALAEEGVGATLQHYCPLIDDAVAAEWKVPSTWKMRAQLPFGEPLAKPVEKSYMPDEERFLVFE
ncbi:Nitroreductase [Trypanosoma melophagium]|uniref:Nitroreductase n=1 Tax=Trypanosoma melophagium TaxID=715481 RepID=UPI00351A8281|nr:Nitroreductase [Trypanosoma melophagium]